MDPELQVIIRATLEAAEAGEVPAVLIGSLVNHVLAEEDPGLGVPRGTLDADFALRVPSFEAYERVKADLISKGLSPDSRIEHRLRRGSAMVDLIPFGPGVAPAGELRWPGSGLTMDVTGLEEACDSAVQSSLAGIGGIRRLTVPAFALLKVTAFQDRLRRGDPKHLTDAGDLLFWLENYFGGDADARRFELPDLGIAGIRYTEAGAALLGLDVGRLASSASDRRLRTFFDLSAAAYAPFINSLCKPGYDEDRPRLLLLAEAFRAGYLRFRA